MRKISKKTKSFSHHKSSNYKRKKTKRKHKRNKRKIRTTKKKIKSGKSISMDIEGRKKLDTINWNLSYNLTKDLYNNHKKKINLFFKEIIVKILYSVSKYDEYRLLFIKDLREILDKKTKKYYVTGLFNLQIVDDLEDCYSVDIDNYSQIEKVVDNHLKLIRSKLNFLDFLSKIFANGNPMFDKYIDTFDNCLRKRDNNFNNKSDVKWYDELCNWVDLEKKEELTKKLKKFPQKYDPKISDLIKKCEPIYDSIEPIEEDTDSYEHTNELITGLNIFTNPNKNDKTFGTFSAGISGHTTDISIMAHLTTSSMYTPTSILVIVGAFIWMIQYYHHSIREIMLAGIVNCTNKQTKDDLLSLVAPLYLPINDDYKVKDIYKKIKDYLHKKLTKITELQIKKKINYDKISIFIEDYFENKYNNTDNEEITDEFKSMIHELKHMKKFMKNLKIEIPNEDC